MAHARYRFTVADATASAKHPQDNLLVSRLTGGIGVAFLERLPTPFTQKTLPGRFASPRCALPSSLGSGDRLRFCSTSHSQNSTTLLPFLRTLTLIIHFGTQPNIKAVGKRYYFLQSKATEFLKRSASSTSLNIGSSLSMYLQR